MRKVKGLLIQAKEELSIITKVEFEDTLENLYKIVNCDLVEMPIRYINHKPYTFIIDEEGTFKDVLIPTGVSKDKKEWIVGNILIVSGYTDNEGNIISLNDNDISNILKAFNPLYGVLTYEFN